MKIKEILQTIEKVAPLALQESYDNSGVQIGDVNQELKSILLSIDVTEEVLDEAIRLGSNLIISHHPIAFKSFKSLTGKNYTERCLIKACKHDIVLYAAHTNLDNAQKGINYQLAKMLNLQNVRILAPQKNTLIKLVTFVPTSHADIVRNTLFNVGAGSIGDYDSCSYNLEGRGTFKPREGTNPYCGEIGKLHTESETRIEVILPTFKKGEVLRALISVHPYEEPAYDFYKLENSWSQVGSGIVGTLPEPMEEEVFLYYLRDILKLSSIQHSSYRGSQIMDVAICGGSGAFLIPQAIGYGADIFVTGEAKYNDFYDVEDKILLATVGHYESEVCSKDLFMDIISDKYPLVEINLSQSDSNPVHYLTNKLEDGLVYYDDEDNRTIIFNHYSFCETLKRIMMQYAGFSYQEASVRVKESNLNLVPHSVTSVSLTSHEYEYHWAMLIAYGEQYWNKGFAPYPPNNSYFEWQRQMQEKNNLKESFVFE